jgi:hypothetical protein
MSDDNETIRHEVLNRLGKLEGKIDILIETNKLHSVTCDADRIMITKNIKDLEKKQAWMLGVGSSIVVVFGALLTYLKGGPT